MTEDNPTFELTDIFQEISHDWQKVIEENIRFILKRENLWQKKYMLCFPAGSRQEISEESYQFDFEIFSDVNTVVASGTCYGSGITLNKDEENQRFEITDMTVEICKGSEILEQNARETVILT